MDLRQFEMDMLSCCGFSNPGDDDKFLGLLATVEREVTKDVATVLLKTFSDVDDYGVQERTRNALQGAPKSEYYPALVEALPGMAERSPDKEWALTLVGMEFDFGDPALLMKIANDAQKERKNFFLEFVSSPEFSDEYPNAKDYLRP